MRYLILPDEASAMARSEQEAQARGCAGTTTHWWGWRETASGEVALLIHDYAVQELQAVYEYDEEGAVISETFVTPEPRDIDTEATDVEPEWPIEQVAQ